MKTEPAIRWVLFDAVGTLIYPTPDVGTIYTQVGQRYGSRLSREEVRARFRAVFFAEERVSGDGARTSESQEFAFWKRVVATVLDDVTDTEACFLDLYSHFGQAQSWSCFEDVGSVIATLRQAGIGIAIGSNFDERLHAVLDGSPTLRDITCRVVSSEVGYRKPAVDFFEAALTIVRDFSGDVALRREEILVIGDDETNDVAGGRAAGFPVIHLHRNGGPTDPEITLMSRSHIRSLSELESAFL